jgi:hypothetical protein
VIKQELEMSKYLTNLTNTYAKEKSASDVIRKFTTAASIKHGGPAYSAGYLGAALSQMAAEHLTKAQFAIFLNQMELAAAKQQPNEFA